MRKWDKDPSAVLDYAFDWSNWLGASETISSATVTVDAGLTKDSQSNTTTKVTVWLSGGTLATIYKTLSRLEEKGLVRSFEGEPTPQRGGRRTRCFAVTIAGRKALESTFATLRRMAVGLDVGLEPT